MTVEEMRAELGLDESVSDAEVVSLYADYLTAGEDAAQDLLAMFRAKYPAFAAVADATVQVWLDEGYEQTARFAEATRTRAALLYAAHNLELSGEMGRIGAAGLTSFKSGTFSATVSDRAAGRTGFAATAYGRDYLALARQFAGPRLAWTPGHV